MDKIREIALKTLYKIDKEEAYSNIALNEIIKENRNKIDDRDIGFISELVYGVTTWRLTLDEIIKKYSNIRLKKISCWIINILRMGIYQIIFLDKIPKSAAVNESVNLAKRYGHKSSSNFVNAILRKVTKKAYQDFFDIENDIERISKTTSMPIWIIEELKKSINIEFVEKICQNSNERPSLMIRINRLKTNKNNFIKLLNDRNIKFRECEFDDFLVLEKVKNIEKLDLFKNGYFTIQDEGAGLIALAMNPEPEDYILDTCSSPGGKTTYIAELMNNKGKIIANDLYPHRIELVKQNARRLGIDIIEAYCKDATIYEEEYKEKFDKILLDVPCLGIGVLKRKPDIKWKRKKEDICEITNLQKQILENCSQYLKSGGILVYSTCSILPAENEKVINDFLKKHKDFHTENLGAMCGKYEKLSNLQLYQNMKNDGFFISKLRKK